MALIRAMRNGCSPRPFGKCSKVDEKTLCTESADKPLVDPIGEYNPLGIPPKRWYSPRACWIVKKWCSSKCLAKGPDKTHWAARARMAYNPLGVQRRGDSIGLRHKIGQHQWDEQHPIGIPTSDGTGEG